MSKNNNGSGKRDMMKLASAFAFIVMVLAIALMIVSLIVSDKIGNVLGMIQNLLLLAAIAIPAYYFTRGKAKWVKILYWIMLAAFVASAILGGTLSVA